MFLFLSACTPDVSVGSVQVQGSLPQSLSTSDIAEVRVTVTAADMSPRTMTLERTGSTWSGTLHEIPAGTQRTFTAEALDSSGTRLYAGQATHVTILAEQTTVVSITLQQVQPPPAFENAAPLITSLTATPGTVAPGGSLSLTATARDANAADTLTYAWTASAGSFASASSPSTTWTAPAVGGPVTLTLTVTDNHGASATVSVTLTVTSGGSTQIEVLINTWPQVSRVVATPTPVEPGETTTAVATASDSDGDALQYQWTASCAGTWADATSATARFTPTTLPAGDTCPNCALTVRAQDGRGGQGTGTLSICVGSKPTMQFPPKIVEAYRSASSVGAGGSVTLGVKATDPQGSALTFSWTANIGTLSAPAHTATSSEVLWTAPQCVPAGASPTITATVSNAAGLSTSVPFSLTGVPACPTNFCGDGTRGESEACDDGNTSNEDNCLTTCVLALCGDGYVDGEAPRIEQCDTAGESPSCNANCTVSACGDGLVNTSAGEQCDTRGNSVTCDSDCTVRFCGDGFLNPAAGEQCDDGNASDGDGCSATCRRDVCGDGLVSGGEACDDGNTVTETSCPYGTPSCMSCNATCTAILPLTGPYCGDGMVSGGEVCDDGNTSACGTCGATCQQAQFARATGSITAVGGTNLLDGERFTLDDGINPPVVFEFDKNGSSSSTSIRVAFTGTETAGTMATAIAAAINDATTLEISATTSSTIVLLTHDWTGAFGNRPLTKSVSNTGFRVSGMAGGAGYDCAAGTRCRNNADCAPSLVCGPGGTCDAP
jgi:cysteine-rich repeat protein